MGESRSVQSTDTANLSSIGFGALDILDGVEIIGVTPTPPEDYMTTSTGDFPVMIIYGMAGLAAAAGIGFFFISSRSMKNAATTQQGIDPSNLVGYQTSASCDCEMQGSCLCDGTCACNASICQEHTSTMR